MQRFGEVTAGSVDLLSENNGYKVNTNYNRLFLIDLLTVSQYYFICNHIPSTSF